MRVTRYRIGNVGAASRYLVQRVLLGNLVLCLPKGGTLFVLVYVLFPIKYECMADDLRRRLY